MPREPGARETGAREAGGKARPRTASRMAAVQALFQSEQTGESPEAVIDQFIRHRLGAMPGLDDADGGYEAGRAPDAEVALFGRIVREATKHLPRIDTLLEEALPTEWPLGRLDPVLRAVLRAGGGELAMAGGAPARVVINEYLDVAHGFFDGEEPRMANGLLNRLARLLRPAEFEAEATQGGAEA